MGYIREPKNIDLVVGPSILTEDTKNRIVRAIAQYRKTGKKSVSAEVSSVVATPVKRVSTGKHPDRMIRKKANI